MDKVYRIYYYFSQRVHVDSLKDTLSAHSAKSRNKDVKEQDSDVKTPKSLLRMIHPLFSCVRECLAFNRVLTQLNISGIPLSAKSIQLIASGIASSLSIREIRFARSKMGDDGLKGRLKFFPLKHRCPSLTSLYFSPGSGAAIQSPNAPDFRLVRLPIIVQRLTFAR
jgi:hypothetical protein